MNAVFKMMAFSILLNASVGLMMAIFPGIVASDPTVTYGMSYDVNQTLWFNEQANKSVKPTLDLEDVGQAFYRLLDKIGLGFITKIIDTVDRYLYGFINLMQAIFGPWMGPMSDNVFPILKGMISFAYVFAAWWLWTGKEVFS